MCNIASDDALDTSYATPPSEDVRGLTAIFSEDEASPSSFGEGHRPKQFYSDTNFMGLVTRTIPANSPDFHSPKGRAAIDAEIADLRSEGVWDEKSVAEWSEVKHIKKDGHTPMCGLVFLIMGQKKAELVGTVPNNQCTFRCRAVFQGPHVFTGDSTPAWMI